MTHLSVTHDPRSGDATPTESAGVHTPPVDAVVLAAEIEVRLTHAGHAPGPGYRRRDALAAVEAYLRAADIPAVAA